ncbi:phage head spike fiber domain-containing protein [Pseudomonas citronellolis]|nr:hypothetical protein [Pseudomonas citronellolis]
MGFISTLGARQAAYELDVLRGRYRTTEGGQVVDKDLTEIATIARNTAGGRINEQGLFEMVPANTPRLDYDPITKAIRGWLIESPSTNLFPRSMDLSRCTAVRCTLQANAGVAPDGTLTAARMSVTSEFDPLISRSVAVSGGIAGKTITFSVFINCDNTTQKIGLYVYGWTNTEQVAFKQFDAVAGWRRYQITQTFTSAATSTGVTVRVDMADGVNPVAGTSMLLWGGQVELLAFASSHIPTPAAFTSRASTALYLDSAGVLRTAAINEARNKAYARDSSGTLRPIGLLLEDQRTNLLLRSGAQEDAIWAKFQGAVGLSGVSGPYGEYRKLSATDGQAGQVYQNVAAAAGMAYTAQYVVRKSSTETVRLYFLPRDASNAQLSIFFVTLNLSTGAITPGGALAATAYSATPTGDGGYLVSITATTPANTAFLRAQIDFAPVTAGARECLIGPQQIEAGATPTSYIPTASAAVTRAADVFTEPTVTRGMDAITANNSAAWLDPDKGTVLVEFTTFSTVEYPGVYTLAPDFFMYADANAKRTAISGRGSAGTLFKTVTQLQDTVIRRADSYDLQGFASSQAGGVTTTTALAQTAKASGLGIGFGGSYRLNGHLRLLRYYPLRVTDIERETLSS